MDRVLVVTAHPDDVDFGAAGTVAAFTAVGVDVAYCVVTDGEAGGNDRSLPRGDMATLRRREQEAAAACVGVTDVTFLGYPDGRLVPSLELRRDVTRVVRRFRPQRVLAPSPQRDWGRIFASHPDHLAAGEAAVAAVYPDARNPFAHPELLEEGLEPWTVGELWLMAFPGSTVVVETTATFDAKLAALLSHRSQIGDPAGMGDRIRQWALATARDAGLPDGSLAEAFRAITTA
ncbi:MAG: PIG-L deacetylase family protein [Acidimicrobiales bacterium]